METTKINTPEQRLELYKKALLDYKGAKEFSTVVGYGLCFYFRYIHKVNLNELPELFAQTPEDYLANPYIMYWFPKSELEPRIKCLESAIKLTEETIKN